MPPWTEFAQAQRRLSLVIGGHVDHGKSTVIGRLLADTGSLPEGKFEQVRATCERNSKPFEYAFLLDALKDEQAQGITIDAARVFFRTEVRSYMLIDAPGHIEFLRNLITGAARAEAALLVIDAREGLQENSRRHGYMMGMLGIRQLVVLVNKMDLVGWDKEHYECIVREYGEFLERIAVRPRDFIPVSARGGDNIASHSKAMPWHQGPTVLEVLDRFEAEAPNADKPFRMPVQDVYKFTNEGDDRRIVAGMIGSGRARVGDEVLFFPSGKKSHIATIEAWGRPLPADASAGEAAGFTLTEQVYVVRGELAALAGEPRPEVATHFRANVFWLGRSPLVRDKDYILKLGTARVPMQIQAIHRVLETSTLCSDEKKLQVDRNEVADVTVKLNHAIAFDLEHLLAETSRFVIVDDFEICGGGIIREVVEDTLSPVRDRVLVRNAKWEPSSISIDRRADRYRQRPALVLMTGEKPAERKGLARRVEERLFETGNLVYFLGIGNVLYGVDADLERSGENRQEHLRRMAEVANLMLDAGLILIVTAGELTQAEVELIKATVDPDRIQVVWVGEELTTDVTHDLVVPDSDALDAVDLVNRLLQEREIISRIW